MHSIQKSYIKPRQHSQKQDTTLSQQVCVVKAMVFPVVKYRCESWTIKKAEHGRTDAFELWCWRRCLRVPWTAWGSNQSILKEIKPDYSLKGLMLKLKLQSATWYGELTHWKRPSCWETLRAGRERGQQRMRWLDSITNPMNMILSKLLEIVKDREAWHATDHGSQRVRHNSVTEQQQHFEKEENISCLWKNPQRAKYICNLLSCLFSFSKKSGYK